jgi:hypothetical protein
VLSPTSFVIRSLQTMTQILSLIQELNDKRLCAKKFFIWRKAHVISTTCLKDEENITIQIELYKKLYKDWHHNAGKINGFGYPTPLISKALQSALKTKRNHRLHSKLQFSLCKSLMLTVTLFFQYNPERWMLVQNRYYDLRNKSK